MDEVDVLTVEQAGMFKVIPRENLYVHRPGVFMAMRQAVEAAVDSLGDDMTLSPPWEDYLRASGVLPIEASRPHEAKEAPQTTSAPED